MNVFLAEFLRFLLFTHSILNIGSVLTLSSSTYYVSNKPTKQDSRAIPRRSLVWHPLLATEAAAQEQVRILPINWRQYVFHGLLHCSAPPNPLPHCRQLPLPPLSPFRSSARWPPPRRRRFLFPALRVGVEPFGFLSCQFPYLRRLRRGTSIFLWQPKRQPLPMLCDSPC